MSAEMATGRMAGGFLDNVRQAASDVDPVLSGKRLRAKELLDTEPIATLRFLHVS